MINFKDITEALQNQITAANVDGRVYTITRNGPVNEDVDVAVKGWVGIYRDSVDYESHCSGPSPWLAEIKIRIVMQIASMAGHEDCERRLDELENFVMTAIEGDRSIGNRVGIIKGYTFDYSEQFDDEDLSIFFQTSMLTITAESRS